MIETTGDVEFLVAKAMQPFDENLETEPYKLRLSASTIAAMARHYGIPETDREALRGKVQAWLGCPGGEDDMGLFALQSYNPDGKFDWYEIGGRYNGWIRGKQTPRPYAAMPHLQANVLTASGVLRVRDFAKRLPFALVTPSGEWIERSSVVETTAGWFIREAPLQAWERRVRNILRTFRDRRVVCVDAHC